MYVIFIYKRLFVIFIDVWRYVYSIKRGVNWVNLFGICYVKCVI